MFFSKKITIESNLSIEEITSRLKNIALDKSFKNIFNESKKPFEGEISENSFEIFPLFYYGVNALGRPRINGELRLENNITNVYITINLPRYILYMLNFILIINLVVLLFSNEIDFYFHLYSFITFFVFKFFINLKSHKSLSILRELVSI